MISTSYTTAEGTGRYSGDPGGRMRFTTPVADLFLPRPDGLTSRPLEPADARAVTDVMAAQQLHDTGAVEIEESDIVGDWQRPSFDLATGTVGVFDGPTLIGYAEYGGGDRGDAAVHPDQNGRGLGTALARWMQDRARAAGASRVGMSTPRDSPGDRLLRALGYGVLWDSWILALPEGQVIDLQPLPDGYRIRTAEETEHRVVWTVIEDAFLEWSDRDRKPFDDFAAQVMGRPGFEPWNLRVVTDPADAVAGAAFVVLAEDTGFVDMLAVRHDQRGLGLGRALLVDAFGQSRAHGATGSELSTDSRSGARGLYEGVGMEVRSTWVHRVIDL